MLNCQLLLQMSKTTKRWGCVGRYWYENSFNLTDLMKAPQETPGIDKAYFKNFWSKTIFSKLWSSYMKGKSVMPIPESFTLKDNIYKLASIFYVYFGFPYKILLEETVCSMAKTIQNPHTLLIRTIPQGLCACIKLNHDNYTLSIRSRLTQLGSCWRKASTMSLR